MGPVNDDQLHPDVVQQINEMVAAKRQLTDEELDALCDVIVSVRLEAARSGHAK
jgi:hypothetical protein